MFGGIGGGPSEAELPNLRPPSIGLISHILSVFRATIAAVSVIDIDIDIGVGIGRAYRFRNSTRLISNSFSLQKNNKFYFVALPVA